ncbi:MAG: flavohemoglobin expression-modulating QEGLA motif protein, partial [Planctomycetes bacterium]|nr:flavohemoglobin expression-modulating QEGLA motif protein [Planctomycetota bacterium]
MTDIVNKRNRNLRESYKIPPTSQASHPFDKILCLILSNIKILKYINPINSNDYKQKYMKGEIPTKCPEFRYREINFDINAVKGSLTTLKPYNDKTLLLNRKAIEILYKLEMLEARGTRTFREISRLLYGSVTINEVRKISDWLNVENESPTVVHYDAH